MGLQDVAVAAVEGQSFSGTVATFTDSDASDPADAPATTSPPSTGATAVPPPGTITSLGGGQYSIAGSHTYADEGTFTVTVSITDPDDPGGPRPPRRHATVADAPLSATGSPDFVSTNPVSGTLATFTDANPGADTSDFTSGGGSTTIDWGDGSSSSRHGHQDRSGNFSVSATHSYPALGPYTITVAITDDGGSKATATTHVTVFAFARGGSFVIGDGKSAVGKAVTFWGARWSAGQFAEQRPDALVVQGVRGQRGHARMRKTGWNTDPGNSAPPPSGPLPSYMGVVVSSSITKNRSVISGNTPHIVVVKTGPGYRPDPGRPARAPWWRRSSRSVRARERTVPLQARSASVLKPLSTPTPPSPALRPPPPPSPSARRLRPAGRSGIPRAG